MTFTRRSFLQGVSAAGSLARIPAATPERPNIILILVDDMGFSDSAAYGSEIDTPNLNRLASEGVRFSQFYSCARCCPSRASLLTGLYPHQAGVGHMVDQAGPAPGYVNDLSPRSRTIAQVLKGAGYQTGMVGKWHVTPVNQSRHNWPLQRGFDRYYGIIHGAADYFNPATLTYGNDPITQTRRITTLPTRSATMRSASSMSSRGVPIPSFCILLSPRRTGRSTRGRKTSASMRAATTADGTNSRHARHARQLRSGMLPKRWDLTTRDATVKPWSEAPDKAWQSRRMEVYAAMIDRMDRNVGRILTKLKETGRDRNTMVLFMSDNGGCAEEIGPKWTGLHIPKATREGKPVQVGNTPGVLPGAEDTYQSYGVPWANCSNTPFRLYKHWVHEGGISSPLIVRWPERIQPTRTWIAEPSHFIDIMATCVDSAGAKYPPDTGTEPVIPLQGRSLLPLVTGSARLAERNLFWEHEGNRAMRRGPWKLVRKFPGEWELYNMDDDRTESNNVAQKHPERISGDGVHVAEMGR